MTDLREKTAKVIADERNGGDPYDISDAIIVALPDMVPDLVWHHCEDGTCHDVGRRYEITEDRLHYRLCRAVTGGGAYIAHFPTLEAAKSAANAHHRSQIMVAFGVTV